MSVQSLTTTKPAESLEPNPDRPPAPAPCAGGSAQAAEVTMSGVLVDPESRVVRGARERDAKLHRGGIGKAAAVAAMTFTVSLPRAEQAHRDTQFHTLLRADWCVSSLLSPLLCGVQLTRNRVKLHCGITPPAAMRLCLSTASSRSNGASNSPLHVLLSLAAQRTFCSGAGTPPTQSSAGCDDTPPSAQKVLKTFRHLLFRLASSPHLQQQRWHAGNAIVRRLRQYAAERRSMFRFRFA